MKIDFIIGFLYAKGLFSLQDAESFMLTPWVRYSGKTLLIHCLKYPDFMYYILSKGIVYNISLRDDNGFDALYHAIVLNLFESVKVLLDFSALITQQHAELALDKAHIDILIVLLNARPDLKRKLRIPIQSKILRLQNYENTELSRHAERNVNDSIIKLRELLSLPEYL
jgi:hypothetical protein